MKRLLLILIIISAAFPQEWVDNIFGLTDIRSVRVYKNESFRCSYSNKKIYCKTEIKPNIYKNVLADKFSMVDTQTAYVIAVNKINSGYIILNDRFIINIYNSFLYPCGMPYNLIYSSKSEGGKVISYSLNCKDKCSLLDSLNWKEISKNEYMITKKNLKYNKVDFGYIDSNFTIKHNYKLNKIEAYDSICEHKYKLNRIFK